MAGYAGIVNAQIGRLVELVTSHSPQDVKSVDTIKAAAAQSLKSCQYSRTNHFTVFATLDGLVEKCQIVGRDDLAEALQERIKLSRQASFEWLPEVLSLLLNLSYRPTEKARPYDVQVRTQGYKQFIGSHGSSDLSETLWRNRSEDIDYTQWSSDQESTDRSTKSSSVSYQSVDSVIQNAEEEKGPLCLYIVPTNQNELYGIRPDRCDSRHSKAKGAAQVSEQYAIRQVLHMLQGLPSNLFSRQNYKGELAPVAGIVLGGLDATTLSSVLNSFAEIGLTIGVLRAYLSEPHTTFTAQGFANSIQSAVVDFNTTISNLENKVLEPNRTSVLTLLSVLHDINKAREFPRILQQIITLLKDTTNFCSVSLVDWLYEKICTSQEEFSFTLCYNLQKTFYQCLSGYLRSVAKWTLQGELDENEPHFFVERRQTNSTLSEIWHSKYEMRKSNSQIVAPRCLRPVMTHLFNIGKDVALLRELGFPDFFGFDSNATFAVATCFEQNPFFTGSDIVPFQVHFLSSLKRASMIWNRGTSQRLCHYLLDNCKGWETVQLLSSIYLAQDFHKFNRIAGCVWDALHLAIARKEFNCESLTNHMRDILANFTQIAGSTVKVLWLNSSKEQIENPFHLMSDITLKFEYGEPIKTIIKPESLLIYHAAFKLLLQLHFCSNEISQLLPQSSLVKQQGGQISPEKVSHIGLGLEGLSLRFSFSWLLYTLKDYFFNIVIVPSKIRLENRWSSAIDVDGLVTAHDEFTSSLATGLFLDETHSSIRRILYALLDLCSTISATTCVNDSFSSSHYSKHSDGRFARRSRLSALGRSPLTDAPGVKRVYEQFKNLLKLFASALREKSRQGNREVFSHLLDQLANNDHGFARAA